MRFSCPNLVDTCSFTYNLEFTQNPANPVPEFIEVNSSGHLIANPYKAGFKVGRYSLSFTAFLDEDPSISVAQDVVVLVSGTGGCSKKTLEMDPPQVQQLVANYVLGDPAYAVPVPAYVQDASCKEAFVLYELTFIEGDSSY